MVTNSNMVILSDFLMFICSKNENFFFKNQNSLEYLEAKVKTLSLFKSFNLSERLQYCQSNILYKIYKTTKLIAFFEKLNLNILLERAIFKLSTDLALKVQNNFC